MWSRYGQYSALFGYFALCLTLLLTDLTVGSHDSGLLLYLWIAATLLLLLRLLTGSTCLPALLRPLRLLTVLLLIAALVPGVIAAVTKGLLEEQVAVVECESKRRYVAMHRGGFGSTWFDVIEMKRLLPMVYLSRPLRQYERESVAGLECVSGGGVTVQLGEPGKPDRTETLGL